MGAHKEHLGNIVRIDDTDFARSQLHIGGIDNHQPAGLKIADLMRDIFGGGTAVDGDPTLDWRVSHHFGQQRPSTVVTHHAIAYGKDDIHGLVTFFTIR
ncbi:hypothetical protein D3C75_1073900 [compost metagenome]